MRYFRRWDYLHFCTMKKVIVLTGAGISAESGLKTFRDSDGLWENFRVEDVATPQAWQADFRLVLQFYNERRKQVLAAKPNAAHLALAGLEKKYDVHIITQNIDDLHERAGSTKVLHLHGEILKSRSSLDPALVYPVNGWELREGQQCEKGSQLRPHIVWFGEMVPELERAAFIASRADVFIVIGTSLQVYPAAGLTHDAPAHALKYYIDPRAGAIGNGFEVIQAKAGDGVPALVKKLME
jgi:NAD-dependent deacetylase